MTSSDVEKKAQDVITAYPNYVAEKQQQTLPGVEQEMKPKPEHLQVEKWDKLGRPYLEEYKGTGKLQGKTAIVTGGDSGIGKTVALFFAREGAKVTIAYLAQEEQDAKQVVKLAQESPMGSKEIQMVCTDLENEENCKQLVEKHVGKWETIDILVNNAGKQMYRDKLEEIDLNSTRSVFESNVIGAMALVKYALPHMRRGGSIIQSTSVTAYKGSGIFYDYAATKGALVSMTRSLAQILAPKGIRVNAIAPGPVYTPLQPASRPAENMEGWGIGSVPLHGRPSQPAEMGASYVFLADAGSSNVMTGQVLHPNHGM